MELLQLQYFLKVAKLQSISGAAEQLNISQPSLSKTISMLEYELGVKLFDRIGKRICLNEHGKMFLQSTRNVLKELDDGINKTKELARTPMGILRLGAFASSSLLTDCLTKYSRLNPYVKFEIPLFAGLQTSCDISDLDLIIYTKTDKTSHIGGIPILEEKFVLVLPPDHAFACKSEVDLIDFKNEKFIFMRSSGLFEDVSYNFCIEAGFEPNVCFTIESNTTKQELISAGAAIGMIPEVCIEGYRSINPKFAFLKIRKPICNRTVYISWKSDNYMTDVAKSFKDFTVSYYGSLLKMDVNNFVK